MRAKSLTRAAAIANPTHIYIIGFTDGIVKVGRTSDPTKRVSTLRSQARQRGAEITDTWIQATDDARLHEWWLRKWGYFYFPRLDNKTEYFYADFTTFLSFFEGRFMRAGYLPKGYRRLTEIMDEPDYNPPMYEDEDDLERLSASTEKTP